MEVSDTSNPPWQSARNLTGISLFSGAGGLDLGFISAGHKVIWANDSDSDSVTTYQTNIGRHIVLSDVADVNPEQLPDADIIFGGLPCQGFSGANINKIDNDYRNNLYLQFSRIVSVKMPKFILVENVRGMLSLNGGTDFGAVQRVLSESGSYGYELDYAILNAANYGVPQNRIRVFLLGIRRDLVSSYRYVFPPQTHAKHLDSNGLVSWVSIGDALRDVPEPEDAHTLYNHVGSKYKVTNRNFTGHRTTNPDTPSPTILARGDGRGGVCAIQHPLNHRRLTVRESAIIQTFPSYFIFSGKLMSMYRQVGNAVPPLLAKKLMLGFQEKAI